MKVFKTILDITHYVTTLIKEGKRIGFVPTMGALHSGHLQLVKEALKENDVAIASIFVNPTQFNNKADLEKYPRMNEADVALLEGVGCSCVFIPEVEEMYPPHEPALDFDLGNLDKVMEGKYRPGHFKGVITIVNKLFNIVWPHTAYFGEKDFQQLAIIRLMAASHHPHVKITGCPTVREKDGLAMSSRNLRLTDEERTKAAVIYKSLLDACQWKKSKSLQQVKTNVIQQINAVTPFEAEYFEIVNAETLQPLHTWIATPMRACIAVQTSTVRLIDNVAM